MGGGPVLLQMAFLLAGTSALEVHKQPPRHANSLALARKMIEAARSTGRAGGILPSALGATCVDAATMDAAACARPDQADVFLFMQVRWPLGENMLLIV